MEAVKERLLNLIPGPRETARVLMNEVRVNRGATETAGGRAGPTMSLVLRFGRVEYRSYDEWERVSRGRLRKHCRRRETLVHVSNARNKMSGRRGAGRAGGGAQPSKRQ